jgi:hypothetical protein
MNEKIWWRSHVKPRWHRPQEKGWLAWKVQDAFNGGLPDIDCCFSGTEAKIELKYLDAWPAREETLVWCSTLDKVTKAKALVSATQHNHLEQWHMCGGNAFVLLGVGKQWLLFRQGDYLNIPQTKAQLIAGADLTYVGTRDLTYETLSQIPPFIIQYYGKHRRTDGLAGA